MARDPDTTPRNSLGATALSRDFYAAADVFRREVEHVFGRQWLCVGRERQIPATGDCRVVAAANESLIVIRDAADEVRAFYNVCRHRGTRLLSDDCDSVGKCIRCPYHGWSYDLDGCLVAAPHMHGVDGFRLDDYPLRSVATGLWEGFVFVNLCDDPTPLEDAFAPVWDRFRPWCVSELISVASHEYIVRANWKLLFQNYNECYHCPQIHPQLNVLSPASSASNDVEAGAFLGGPMALADGVASMTHGGGLCGDILASLNEADQRRVYYYSLFPTLLVSPHPDFVLTHRITPIAVDRTHVRCEFLFPPSVAERSDFDPTPAVAFWDETNRQDWQICEQSQLGVSSRAYQAGPYSNRECTVAAFDRHYLDVMELPP